EAAGMAGELSEADLERMNRTGVRPITEAQGLALFDTAGALRDAALVPIDLDLKALRTSLTTSGEELPSLFRGLIRTTTRRATTTGAGAAGAVPELRAQLAGLTDEEQETLLLDAVRTHAAVILGHAGPDSIEPDRAFSELGFDSLSAVEFRNLMNTISGLRLPPTLVFDYPNARALADHMRTELAPDTDGAGGTAGDEEEIRRFLRTIPLSRLREAGLLDSLLELGGLSGLGGPGGYGALGAAQTGPDEPDEAAEDSIDDMDTDRLISMALGAEAGEL
ncbi:beta-ketoacyl reductase, partial [Streptomyces monticola]